MRFQTSLLVVVLAACLIGSTFAQDESTPANATSSAEKPPEPQTPESPNAKSSTTDQIKDTANKLATQAEAEVEKMAKQVDQVPMAKTVSAGILQPIYVVAEHLSFPAFHWLAFALLSAGVFSFALQLVLGKLVVLTRRGFSFKEILSDAVGLLISVVGLVLTTQAAAQNSSFTQSPAAVISATVVGAFLGIILYLWGQSQEIEAAAGRSKAAAKKR